MNKKSIISGFFLVFIFVTGFLHAMEEKDSVDCDKNVVLQAQKKHLQKVIKNATSAHSDIDIGLNRYVVPAVIAGSFLVGSIYSAYKGNFKIAGACAGGSMASCLFFPAGTFAQREFDARVCEKVENAVLNELIQKPVYLLYPGCNKFTVNDIKALYQQPKEFNNAYVAPIAIKNSIRSYMQVSAQDKALIHERAQKPLIGFLLSSLFSKEKLISGEMINDVCIALFKADLRQFTSHLLDTWGKKEIDTILAKGSSCNANDSQKLSAQAFSFFAKNINKSALKCFLSFQDVNTISNTKKEEIGRKSIDIFSENLKKMHFAISRCRYNIKYEKKEIGREDLYNFSKKVENIRLGSKYNALYILHTAFQDGILARRNFFEGVTLFATDLICQCLCDHAMVLFGKQEDANKENCCLKLKTTICKDGQCAALIKKAQRRSDIISYDLASFYYDKNNVNYDKVFCDTCKDKYIFSMSSKNFKTLQQMNVVTFKHYWEGVFDRDWYSGVVHDYKTRIKLLSIRCELIKANLLATRRNRPYKDGDGKGFPVYLPREIIEKILKYCSIDISK